METPYESRLVRSDCINVETLVENPYGINIIKSIPTILIRKNGRKRLHPAIDARNFDKLLDELNISQKDFSPYIKTPDGDIYIRYEELLPILIKSIQDQWTIILKYKDIITKLSDTFAKLNLQQVITNTPQQQYIEQTDENGNVTKVPVIT